jgi:hypothetical protein
MSAVLNLRETPTEPKSMLNLQQQAALDELAEWWKSDDDNIIILGKPGTGKTFLMRAFAQSNPKIVALFTAPTNEAVRQLELSLQGRATTRTTYSALGLAMSTWSEKQEIYQKQLPEDFYDYNLLVVDEASMAGKKMGPREKELLIDYVQASGIRVVWLGDDCQLPPVESYDGTSPLFNLGYRTITLSQVMRHSGPILEFADLLREEIYKPVKNLPKVPDGIESVAKSRVSQYLLQVETFDKLRKGDCRIIVWRNNTADSYNQIVRAEMFGAVEARNTFLFPEDQILFTKPLFSTRDLENLDVKRFRDAEIELVCSINTKAQVTKVSEIQLFGIETFRAELNVEGGMNCVAYVPTRRGEMQKKKLLDELAETAKGLRGKAKGDAWGYYHKVSGIFASVKHSYCITGHRSQGSTIDEVFVDVGDMLANPTRLVAFKNLYVGATRAKNRLNLIRG